MKVSELGRVGKRRFQGRVPWGGVWGVVVKEENRAKRLA